MSSGEFADKKRFLSVKEAMDMYGDRRRENSLPKKPQFELSETFPRKKELHRARRDMGRFSDSRKVAESVKARAELELNEARKTVRDLSIRIEESNSRAKLEFKALEKMKNPRNQEHSDGDGKYHEVMKELEQIKHEVSKLKLEMASVLDEKRRADKESEASTSRLRSYSNSLEVLKMEIDELNEEHVLVELARIEALKESEAIKKQRDEEERQYSSAIEETKKKVDGLIQEIDNSKDFELKIAITEEDVDGLRNQLALIKQIDNTSIQETRSLKHENESELLSVTEELEAAKKELATIKEEGFQFMASMDIIRNELNHVMDETARIKRKEDKADLTVQTLNSKLLRAKSKLESVSAAEEKATMIVSNLSLTLEHLKTEAEAGKKERELVSEETAKIKSLVPKIESEIDIAEEKLQVALQDLEEVKSKEATALENLKNLIEITVKARAAASQNSSRITITSFEYEYLQGRAAGAEEIADKKVAAAQAWIEALKANEKEILMKTEMTKRELRDERAEKEEEEEDEDVIEGDFCNLGEKYWLRKENMQIEVISPRKNANKNGTITPARRSRYRKSFSPAARHLPRTPSSSGKNRKEGGQKLGKYFSSKNIERGL